MSGLCTTPRRGQCLPRSACFFFLDRLALAANIQQRRLENANTHGIIQLDFDFVLFASAIIDYDYIMALITRYANQGPKKLKLKRDELVGLIRSEARFMDDSQLIVDYIDSLGEVKGRSEDEIRAGFERFREERQAAEVAALAEKHHLATDRLQAFIDTILKRMVFDGEQLTELMQPLGLNWKARRVAELALMEDLVPLLKKRDGGREVSGLNAYES